MKIRNLPGPAIIALAMTALAAAIGWLQPIDQHVQDLRASLMQQAVPSDLVIIEIDARSLRQLEGWPWPRRYHAELLDRLREAGVAGIFYDVDFSSPSSPADDRLLSEALAGFPDNTVMLPIFVQPGNQLATEPLVVAEPLEKFRANSPPAVINIRPDRDGLVRRIPGSVHIGDDHAVLAGIRISGRFDYLEQSVLIDYAIHPESFTRLSFADVIAGRFDPGLLRDKPVFVGATALELGDMIPVPVYQSLPGIVVQALAYQTLMQGGFATTPTMLSILSTLLLFALLRAVLGRVEWRSGLILVIAGLALIICFAVYAGHEWRIAITVAPLTSLLVLGYAFSLIARLEQQHLRLQHQATHDALTGLGNRYYLGDQLHRNCLIAERSSASYVALLMLDLDRFKEINDTLGHVTGDLLLRQVAERFTACVGGGTALARIGGDEFAVVLPDTPDARHSRELGERLLEALKQPILVNNIALEIGASIGIALYPSHAQDPALLMQHADTAMYVAKESGSGLSLYQPEYAKRNTIRMAVSTGLRTAIAEDRLELHYQPKLDIAGNAPAGAEALLRWRHPEFGYIDPETIVEVAESAGLIWLLTEWTIGRALDEAQSWHVAGYPLRIAVNLSARLLQDRMLADRLSECLANRGLSAQWLTLEITESAIMADPEAALKNTAALKAAGIRLSIDDFGTGYSSLGYLKDLPADELKIDKSFVMDMLKEPRNALIVKSTIELAHNLGLEVVAEGVESAAVLNALSALDCEIAQGYHISRPVSAETFRAWLEGMRARNARAFPVTAGVRLLASR